VNHAIAAYLPESMLIKLSSAVAPFDDTGNLVKDPLPLAYFFHEYVHFLHNISTVSGILVFINTLELWRCFRTTIDGTGASSGSEGFDSTQKDHLRRLSAYLIAARASDDPKTNITRPERIQITSLCSQPCITGLQGELLTTLVCDAVLSDRTNSDSCIVRIGTHELLESAAWVLEKRMAEAIDPAIKLGSPHLFPYRVVEAAVEYTIPKLDEETVLCCVLSALQSSDAPDALDQILIIIKQAIQARQNPMDLLRQTTVNALQQSLPRLEAEFQKLEAEFNGSGVLAVSIRRIIATAREAVKLRLVDPFFELKLIDDTKGRPDSFRDAISHIAPCAVLQGRVGPDDDIERDLLLSFYPSVKESELDPEDGFRVLHSVFHFIGCHRTREGFRDAETARHASCPFYTCCTLDLRKARPDICKNTPWLSADWLGWHQCIIGTQISGISDIARTMAVVPMLLSAQARC
jgi:hypothetical protein